jgi:hypothetical protein
MPEQPTPPPTVTTYVDDAWIAAHIRMSIATIRGQRFKRLHKCEHWLTVDPVYIGSKPRYRLADVQDWLATR